MAALDEERRYKKGREGSSNMRKITGLGEKWRSKTENVCLGKKQLDINVVEMQGAAKEHFWYSTFRSMFGY